jgi:hypothetical protein
VKDSDRIAHSGRPDGVTNRMPTALDQYVEDHRIRRVERQWSLARKGRVRGDY